MRKFAIFMAVMFACAFIFGCAAPDVKVVEGKVVSVVKKDEGKPTEGVIVMFDDGEKLELRAGGAEKQLVVGQINVIKIYKNGENANRIYSVQIK